MACRHPCRLKSALRSRAWRSAILLALLGVCSPAQDSAPASRPLAGEKSPYLRQHLNNPVIWYPWGDEAFAKAAREGKPIFLSIGYAACHWCHVMEKESFEDAGIAAILNESYVPVKVDREERPDVDEIYMHAAIAMTGHGGWPLTMFLTPDKKPFWAATYLPREDAPNQTGLKTLLASIRQAWKEKRSALLESASRLDEAIRAQEKAASAPAPKDLLAAASEKLLSVEDKDFGGFGTAPKFPSPCDALALLRQHARTGNAAALEAVKRQYEAMWRGGIHDHLGGGFHRYATDRKWEVPHFEKMLYDEALIARGYLELSQTTPGPRFAGKDWERPCQETLEFCLSTLRNPEGGFIAALDATVNGVEGGTYLWSRDEIEKVLLVEGVDPAPVKTFERMLGFDSGQADAMHAMIARQSGGYFETKEFSFFRLGPHDNAFRHQLLEARNKRPQPARDEHVITAWNAWMISTLARTGMVLNEPRYKNAALDTMAFLDAKLRQPDGLYARRITEGEARFAGTLSDQAAVAEALLDLHEMTLDPKWLDRAVDLVPKIVARFSRPDGSFVDSVEKDLIYHPRDLSDGSTPSGVSQMNVALARLARITGNAEDLARARRAILAALPEQAASPADHAYGAIAWDLAFRPVARVEFRGAPAIVALLRAPVLMAYRPHVVMTTSHPGDERASAVVSIEGVSSQPLYDSAAIIQALERLAPKPESR